LAGNVAFVLNVAFGAIVVTMLFTNPGSVNVARRSRSPPLWSTDWSPPANIPDEAIAPLLPAPLLLVPLLPVPPLPVPLLPTPLVFVPLLPVTPELDPPELAAPLDPLPLVPPS
jgi:hypothetical protein